MAEGKGPMPKSFGKGEAPPSLGKTNPAHAEVEAGQTFRSGPGATRTRDLLLRRGDGPLVGASWRHLYSRGGLGYRIGDDWHRGGL